MSKHSSSGHADVINLEDHAHTLSGKSDGTGRHEGRLHNILFGHVLNLVLLDVKSSIGLSFVVSVSEFSHKADGVHTSVLSESVGDELKGFTIGSGYVRVRAKDLSGVLLELVRHLHLNASSSLDSRSLLD